MRKLLLLISALAAAVAFVAVPASAITDGELDNGRHPWVGMMLALDKDGYPLWRCTGTAMSATVYMTAGHCTEAPADHAEIFFADGPILTDPDYLAAVQSDPDGRVSCNENPAKFDGYPCKGDTGGAVHIHPQYDPNAFYLYDLGVVTHPSFARSSYGQLPQLNALDVFDKVGKKDASFTSVGYGLQKSFPDATSWKDKAVKVRMVAYPKLNQINGGIVGDFSLLLSNNAHTGGTCFGDSGGPNFLFDTRVVAAVTSFGLNSTCGGTGGVYRVDRKDDLDWLATFGLTPA